MSEGSKRTWTAEDVERMVKISCAAQGVPEKVTDPTTLRRVAALFGAPVAKPPRGRHRA